MTELKSSEIILSKNKTLNAFLVVLGLLLYLTITTAVCIMLVTFIATLYVSGSLEIFFTVFLDGFKWILLVELICSIIIYISRPRYKVDSVVFKD